MRFKSPAGMVFLRWVVRCVEASIGVILDHAIVPLVEQPHHSAADHLVRVTVAQSAGVHRADMACWFQQDDRGPFPRRRDRGTEAAGSGSVDDDVGDLPSLRLVGAQCGGENEQETDGPGPAHWLREDNHRHPVRRGSSRTYWNSPQNGESALPA